MDKTISFHYEDWKKESCSVIILPDGEIVFRNLETKNQVDISWKVLEEIIDQAKKLS